MRSQTYGNRDHSTIISTIVSKVLYGRLDWKVAMQEGEYIEYG